MPPVVIDNPILNGPFTEPTRHFRFSDDGITDEAVEGRRASGYFLPMREGGYVGVTTGNRQRASQPVHGDT